MPVIKKIISTNQIIKKQPSVRINRASYFTGLLISSVKWQWKPACHLVSWAKSSLCQNWPWKGRIEHYQHLWIKFCKILTIPTSYRNHRLFTLGPESCQLGNARPLRTEPKGRGTQTTGSWALPHFSHVTSFSSSKTYLLGTVSALTVTLILTDMLYPSPSVLCVSYRGKPILCLSMRVPGMPSQWQEHSGMTQDRGKETVTLALNRALWNSVSPSCVWRLNCPSSSGWGVGKGSSWPCHVRWEVSFQKMAFPRLANNEREVALPPIAVMLYRFLRSVLPNDYKGIFAYMKHGKMFYLCFSCLLKAGIKPSSSYYKVRGNL